MNKINNEYINETENDSIFDRNIIKDSEKNKAKLKFFDNLQEQLKNNNKEDRNVHNENNN